MLTEMSLIELVREGMYDLITNLYDLLENGLLEDENVIV